MGLFWFRTDNMDKKDLIITFIKNLKTYSSKF